MSNAGTIDNFHAADNSAFLKFKLKVTDKTGDGDIKDVKKLVPLKCLSNFWRTLEMSFINCEINLILTWSDKCVLSNDTNATAFVITDTKLYVPDVTLSTQDNAKLLKQLKSGFERTIKWNRYQTKVSVQAPNPYLDFLIDLSF